MIEYNHTNNLQSIYRVNLILLKVMLMGENKVATKKTNKLPDGVGKRIIETLKNQEYQLEDEEAGLSEPDTEENTKTEVYIAEEDNQDEFDIKNERQQEFEQEVVFESKEVQFSAEDPEINYVCSSEVTVKNNNKYEKQDFYRQEKQNKSDVSDIDTLLNLINQLPSGVTKQTGALIIRQTMEAMGISMNKVLSDAQSVQEDLENNIKNNINVIEEYRTKVKILEQEIQKFRKKAHELEDIISLFILSDDKK